MGPRQQVWVSWSVGALSIAEMEVLVGILRMLATLLPGSQMILLSGTQTMKKSPPKTRDHSVDNGLGKITKWHYTVILEAILQKESIEKECLKSGQNLLDLRQQTKDSLTRLGK